MAALDARLKAFEGSYFRTEQKLALERHIERLVVQGRLPESALRAAAPAAATAAAGPSTVHLPALYADVPTTVRSGRPEWVYEHKKLPYGLPAPSVGERFSMGTRVSLGRARWTVDGASIFSVADGKRLAQTPVKEVSTPWDNVRVRKIEAAARETPLVAGFRVLPELTPGRAFLWGSVLALFGTACVVKYSARGLGIESAEDAPGVLRAAVSPYRDALEAAMAPLRDWMSIPALASGGAAAFAGSDMARRLRAKLGRGRQPAEPAA